MSTKQINGFEIVETKEAYTIDAIIGKIGVDIFKQETTNVETKAKVCTTFCVAQLDTGRSVRTRMFMTTDDKFPSDQAIELKITELLMK